VYCISGKLTSIQKNSAPQDIKILKDHLLELRTLINLYFDIQKLSRTPFVPNAPAIPTSLQEVEQNIKNYQGGIANILPDAKDTKMRIHIASISLFLARLIKFYKFPNSEIFHLP
jgi:hypothetical protein